MNESSEETEHSHTRPKNFFFPPFRERKSKKSVSIFQKSLELRGLVWCSVCCFLADTTMNDDGDCLGCLLTFLFLMCLDLILMGFTGSLSPSSPLTFSFFYCSFLLLFFLSPDLFSQVVSCGGCDWSDSQITKLKRVCSLVARPFTWFLFLFFSSFPPLK